MSREFMIDYPENVYTYDIFQTPENLFETTLTIDDKELVSHTDPADRIIRFLNYNLTSLQSDLWELYQLQTDIPQMTDLFISIHKQLRELFGFDSVLVTRIFIEYDYARYIYYNYRKAESTSDQDMIRDNFYVFLAALHTISSDMNSPIRPTSIEKKISNIKKSDHYIRMFDKHVQTPTANPENDFHFCFDTFPPYYLLGLQKKLKSILTNNVQNHEIHRLSRPFESTVWENIYLRKMVAKKAAEPLSFSEFIVKKNFAIKLNTKVFTFVPPQSNANSKPADDPFMATNLSNLNDHCESIRFSIASNYNPKISDSLSFQHIETIFCLDFHYLLKEDLYVKICPHCEKYFTKTKNAFYCDSACRKAHETIIDENCPPRVEYENIRKKLIQQKKRFTMDSTNFYKFLNAAKSILDKFYKKLSDTYNQSDIKAEADYINFFTERITALEQDALDELSKVNDEIKKYNSYRRNERGWN